MKVIIATRETQGQRRSDFAFADEGEIVLPAEPHDDEPVDGACGCQRSFDGISSGRATTTAKVADLPLTKEQYCAEILRAYPELETLLKAGWPRDQVLSAALEFLEIAKEFPAGAILERRGEDILERKTKTTPATN